MMEDKEPKPTANAKPPSKRKLKAPRKGFSIEEHPAAINLFASVLTSFIIIITLYYSYNNLKVSQDQNKQSQSQLELAKKEFENTIEQEKSSHTREIRDNENEKIKDSVQLLQANAVIKQLLLQQQSLIV